MDKLPNEVYQSILNLLPRETILECTHVCRKWTTTARECLHSDVSIETKEALDKFMEYINAETLRRNQVKSFRLFIKPLHHYDKRSVCNLFPNLRQVDFLQYEGDTTLPDFSKTKVDTATAMSTIESVSEYGDDYFVLHLIESNLCERLGRLYIRHQLGNQHSLIYQLKNMPVLKVLTLILDHFHFTFEHLERLHQEIPSLVDLFIGQIVLVKNIMPVDIQSTSIKNITLNFKSTASSADLTEAYLQYFEYVSRKYPNLENIALNVVDREDFTMEDMERVLDFGWTPLLRSLGSQLKSIQDIDVMPDFNIFKMLDELGCKLEDLSVNPYQGNLTLAEFCQSNQSKYIHELFMTTIIHPSDCLRDTQLVKLTLFDDLDGESLVLNHFLRICPDTLKYLRLESFNVEYDQSSNFQCPSLISLDINTSFDGEIESGVGENVYKCCPNLKKLRLGAWD